MLEGWINGKFFLCVFDLIYRALKAIKGKAIADHLDDLPLEDYEPVRTDFPDEELLALESTEEISRKY